MDDPNYIKGNYTTKFMEDFELDDSYRKEYERNVE